MPNRTRSRRPIGGRRSPAVALISLVVGLTVLAVGCSGTGGGKLLLASDTSGAGSANGSAQNPVATDIWEVGPGEAPSNSNRVASGVASPLYINSMGDDGIIARDLLGTTWDGRPLLSFRGSDGESLARVADPGADGTTIAGSTSQLQATVLRRGVYVATAESCVLARSSGSADDAETVGQGLCQVSEDERWVVSWPATQEGGTLTIRDLRTGDVRRVEGNFTGAVVLGRGKTVLAVEATESGARGVVISAGDAKVVERTATYTDLQPMPTEPGSTGFVALAATDETAGTVSATELLWIDTSGKVRVIDRGALMLPIRSDSEVTYVRFDTQALSDSIRRWDSTNSERTVLLSGRVGAAAVGGDSIVATRDGDDGVELYRSDGLGDLEHVTTLPGDGTASSTVDKILTQGDTTLLQLRVAESTALARIDLHGDDSSVPVSGWADLRLEGVDADGTALVSGRRDADGRRETIGVVTPHSDSYVERTTAEHTGLNLIHQGTVYVTDQTAAGKLTVRTVKAQGSTRPATLWHDHQLAGATWPTDNGATTSTLISRAAVLQRQQQSQAGG